MTDPEAEGQGPAPEPATSTMPLRQARLLVFTTSAAVLVLEILAGRLVAPHVGVSLETFTAIIGTVLAGIAVGNTVGGQLADRHPPIRLIGPALVIGGSLAWLSLPVVALLGPEIGNGPLAVVALALFGFTAPAAVLSAISPMVAKLRLDDLDRTGEVVGTLSAAGTLGALVGTFLTGFVLVAWIPTRLIVILVGAALVLWGLQLTWRHRGRPDPLAAAGVVLALGLAALTGSPCDFESTYFCGSIETDADDPSLRSLYLDDLRHAAVDLDDPTNLDIRYVRLLADVVDALPEGPLRVLHIGGGGFTLPRYIEAVRPGSTSLVLEIDPMLVDVAEEHLGLVRSERLRVEVGDARLAIEDLPDDAYDLVIGDAFASLSVPWHLTTTEFVDEIARVLDVDGVYAMNLIDGDGLDFLAAELATLDRSFDRLAVIRPAEPTSRPSNHVILAGRSELPAVTVAGGDGALDDDVAELVADGFVLTDDHAPVDRLITAR